MLEEVSVSVEQYWLLSVRVPRNEGATNAYWGSSTRYDAKSTNLNVSFLSLWHSFPFLWHLGDVLSWNKSSKVICNKHTYVSLDQETLCLFHQPGLQIQLLLLVVLAWLSFFFFGNLFSPLTIGKLPTYLTGLVTVRPAQIQVVKLCLCFSIFCLQVLPLNRGGGGNTAVEATAVVLLHVQSLISGLEHELGA